MIRVNLAGVPKKPAGQAKGSGFAVPTNLLPVVWIAILLGAAAVGYFWYSSLSSQRASLDDQLSAAREQLAGLQSVIAENELYEARREMLAERIGTIQSLQRDQVSPVVLLDELSEAITPIQYVWLSQFGQNDTTVTMAGFGTSVNAIADFVTSLENTGYFRNINLVNAQDTDGNFAFQMICDFVPPAVSVGGSAGVVGEGVGQLEAAAD